MYSFMDFIVFVLIILTCIFKKKQKTLNRSLLVVRGTDKCNAGTPDVPEKPHIGPSGCTWNNY